MKTSFFKKSVSLLLSIVLLLSGAAVLPAAFAADALQTPYAADETQPSASDEALPALPDGWRYTGAVYTDEQTDNYYLITGPVSESGCADVYWVNAAGEKVGTGLTPFSEPTDLKSDPAYLPEAAQSGAAKKAPGSKSAAVLPAAYDARSDGLLTPIRIQVGGTCWAHGVIAAVEANAIKNGLTDADTVRLSEYHLAWYSTNGWYEGVTDSRNDGMVTSPLTRILSEGGSSGMAKRALLNFAGPASRSHYGIATTQPELLEIMQQEFTYENKYDRELVVTDLVEIENERAAIKNAVLKYGAVTCTYSTNDSCYNGFSHPSAYYSAGRPGELHQVAIVGWDDAFSKENFTALAVKPNADGAWLIRNSWGTGRHDEGYFWMSYEEPSLGHVAAFVTASDEDFQNVYFYDGAGVSAERTATAAANIFTAGGNEYLTKVSHGEKTDAYTFSVYGDLPADCTDPTAGTLLYTQSGDAGGVQFIDVEGPVSLTAGERFSVVFTDLTKAYTENASTEILRYTGNPGESFICADGAWQDTELLGYHNVCVRAVTKDTAVADSYQVRFSCPGKYSETAYSQNGAVALPEREGCTCVLTYNGAPFDGTGVDRDITVNMHCYPTAGCVSENDPCARRWECIWCGKQFEAPQIEHDHVAATVTPGPAQPGYTQYTCSRCGDTYYEDFVGYDNAPGGIVGNYIWQVYDGVLSVDGAGGLPDMPSGGQPWYSLRASVRSLYLSDGITGIGAYNFASLTAMESIRWSSALETIGDYAFRDARSLTTLVFPDSLLSIGKYAFRICYALTEIVFNDALVSIDNGAFTSCNSLTEVTVPASLGVCDTSYFYNCQNLRRVVIEEGITSLLRSPVYYNSPNASGYALEEIVIPASVGGISEDFSDTGSYAGPQRYTVSPDNPLYVDADGVIFTKDMQNLVCYPMRKPGTYYAVPATVNKVLPNAFRLNQTLRFLDLSGMRGTWIRDYTCLWMTSVEHINLPPNTTRLFYQALGTTHRLEKIFIPASASLFESNSLDATKVGTVYTDSASAPVVAYAAQKGIDCVVLEGHEHSYDTREYVERTNCSQPGFAIDVCECGQFRYTALEADHTPGAPVETVVRAATCSVKGEKSVVVKCVDCGETLSETTAPIDFDPANHADYSTDTENAAAATCHSNGYTGDTVCARCRAVLIPGETIPKDTVPHAWDDGEVTLEPTCKTAGTVLYRCTAAGCGATKENEIPVDPDGHVIRVTVTDPTCTEGGYTTHACTLCSFSYTDNETDALGHTYAIRVTPATCTSGGITTYTCTRCRDSYTKNPTAPVDHVDNNHDGYCDFGCGTRIQTQQPDEPQSNCVCGQYHTGPMAGIIKFFHQIVYFFKNLFNR